MCDCWMVGGCNENCPEYGKVKEIEPEHPFWGKTPYYEIVGANWNDF